MEPLIVNYWAVLICAVVSMALGAIWYGPLFGKQWMQIIGVDPSDKKAVAAMQKSAGPLYGVQFILTLFQVLVLSHLIADTTRVSGVERALWICAAFVLPTLAGAVMWTNDSSNKKWLRFTIQAGYQLVLFILFGLILQYWK